MTTQAKRVSRLSLSDSPRKRTKRPSVAQGLPGTDLPSFKTPAATSAHLALRIEQVPVDSLIPDDKNARRHPKRQVRQIAESIRVFGFNVPVLVDDRNKIIAGHGRVLAAQSLNFTTVPVIRLRHLTPEQARAYMIADNRLTDVSTWDDAILAQTLKELSEIELNFSLEATGFHMGEIDFRISEWEQGSAGLDGEPAGPPPSGPAITRPGDLWLIGKHHVYCGDSRDPASYQKLMGSARADVVFTDPPYNVRIDGHATGNGATTHREFAFASGEMDAAQFTAFLAEVCCLMAQYSRSGALHFICMDWRHLRELLIAGEKVYSELKNICVWAKDVAGMGSMYRSQHELVLVWKSGKGAHRNNVELGVHGRHRSNVWTYPSPSAFGRKSEEGSLLAMHPTVKPINLVADALLDSSKRGAIVLDTFLGSGTSLLAADRTGRVCYGIEYDPLYVDLAIRRLQRMTGQLARHATTGALFDDVSRHAGEGQ